MNRSCKVLISTGSMCFCELTCLWSSLRSFRDIMERIKVDIGRQIPPLEQFDKQIINFKNLKQDTSQN